MTPFRARLRPLLALAGTAAVSLSLAACGGDDEPTTTETETTTEATTVAATDLEECLLSSDLQRGVYETIANPSEQFIEAAEGAGAEVFGVVKADDGFAYFYVFEDAAPEESFQTELQGLLEELARALGSEAPQGLGDPSVQVSGQIVYGVLPFSPDKTEELPEETAADLASCLEELQ